MGSFSATSRLPAPSLLFLLFYCTSSTHGVDACSPDSPAVSPRSSAQAADDQGLQVLVPSYEFTCNGTITGFTIRADPQYGDDGFIFQTWRLQQNDTYSLRQSVNVSGRRDRDKILFNSSILVQTGDIIGYRLEPVADKIHFLLDMSNTSENVVIYRRDSPDVMYQFSLNDSNNPPMAGFAPYISVQFEQQDMAECGSEENMVPCNSSDIPTSPSLSLLSPSPSPSPTGVPTTTDHSGTDEGEEEEDDTLVNLNLTKETVIVLAIGIGLFLVLIALVIVLVACICHRRKPTQFRFKSPTPGSMIGTRITNVAASSVHHVNGAAARPDEVYINSAMQSPLANGSRSSDAALLGGSIDPLSPSDHHEVDHGHRGRRMRSPLLPEFPRDPLPPVPPKPSREPIAHSRTRAPRDAPSSPSKVALLPPSCSSSVSPHSGSIPPNVLPTTVPPPAAIALQLAAHAISSPSTPTDSLPPLPTSHPPPLSTTQLPATPPTDHPPQSYPPVTPSSPPTPQPPSLTATTDTSGQYQSPRPLNSYEDTEQKSGRPYDHLVNSGKDDHTPGLRPRPNTGSDSRDSTYIYTYVPTEEQRRLIKMQNTGRYEVTDGMDEVKGYDRLKYFKESETYWSPAATTSGLYEQLYENKYRELPREQIIIQEQIGSGHFGSVSKGVWQLRGEGGEVVEGEGVRVAVKLVKTEAGEMQRVKLLQEAAIMGQFAHPNVVRLNGVVTVGDPTMIVLEYMPQGDLKSYLQRMRPQVSKKPVPRDAPRLFIRFGKDIAAGMSYLARKNFVHRDLATRNILLSHNLTCKIGDFGMARDIAGSGGGSNYYKSHGGIIPVKWTAPESLNYNKYTSASDVWSYGMVLFEIWSLGHKPFHDLANPIVIALVTGKHCQAPPPGCPRPIYHLMVECWNPTDTQRPTFDCIQTYLDSPDNSLLQWSPSDTLPGKQAHILGAPLVEGNDLYIELQRTYQNQLLARMQSNNT